MSLTVPPGRHDHADPAERLYDALPGVELSEAHRRFLHIVAGLDAQTVDDAVSLFHAIELTYGTHPAPRPRRRADWNPRSLPPGAISALAEGFPSFIVIGIDPGPPASGWLHCTLCRFTLLGLRDGDDAQVEAAKHVREDHIRTYRARGGAR